MTIFTIAAWLVGIGCVAMIGMGFYAITLDKPEDHPQTYIDSPMSVCSPSRQNTLTGANLDSQQEIESLRNVIRQRNRTIKQLRAELEQQQAPVEQPQQQVVVSGSGNRFEWLEIRGGSCE